MALVVVLAGLAAAVANPTRGDEVPRCASGDFSPQPGVAPARAGQVVLRLSSVRGERDVTWILTTRNRTTHAVGLIFPSSPYADVVLRRRGRAVYAWSEGRGVYPAFWYRTLAAGETYTCSLAPDTLDFDSLQSGRYHLIGFLNTYQLSVQSDRTFTITDG